MPHDRYLHPYLDTEPMTNETPVKLTREIPLWGILSIIGVIALQAVALYYQQQRHSELLTEQSRSIAQLTQQIQQLNGALNGKDLKDVEHDLHIRDVQRRLSDIESKLSSKH